jgi:oligopeptide/dipeptide ABC transporter ATP-binding protein
LAIVRRLCDRVLVLYLGKPMELTSTEELYERPLHPYTRGLIDAVPLPDPDIQPSRLGSVLTGELPSPLAPPSGCVFRTRCPIAEDRCASAVPVLEQVMKDHHVACVKWQSVEQG